MIFTKESDFEEALIGKLKQKGWDDKVLKYPTEEDLLKNWAKILYENNRDIDRLNDYPLTDTEMQQIMEQIIALKTPLKLNGFINGKTVAITRDNPDDKAHVGKEVSLRIYDRMEIAAGQSRYQIAEQPVFKSKTKILPDRRGDFMLLINGMPVFHVELKKSNVDVSQAYNQIEKYAGEGIFSGIFSLVQVFVAMNPDETVYFANPGPEGIFNKDFYFHWADFNNEPINDWTAIASSLLSIPMAHQMIGFYTVADNTDGILKVMRSYQYYAANRISDTVSKADWGQKYIRGGYIWHTTGSGKTMTSFKSAQLIANSKDADKVIFLMDRIELGTQSLMEYRGFADETETVQATEDTSVLVNKLKSPSLLDTLIVTSIQKLSRIKTDEGGANAADIELINKKRLVIIIDEAHRSTFGDMLTTIKNTFTHAIFFGFTGTPIQEENQKKMSTTATIFGNELHRYSIADGIRDKNVLGFDPYMVLTYKDIDIRREVALMMAKALSEEEAIKNKSKSEIFYKYMDPSQVRMAGSYADDGSVIKGIEDYLPKSQYERSEHQEMVVTDILDNWIRLSHNGKFHAIFATSSIPEAIVYYRLLKEKAPGLKVTALFDPNIDNLGGVKFKEDGLVEIIDDYNKLFDKDFTIATHAGFKKDISKRLAHKDPYKRIEITPKEQLNLLIVVDQMLTGFDSKWINTLYMDKVLAYENIIQAFSRTNRLFGPEKPFGTIRYYRYPHSMAQNIELAVKLYSGDKPIGLFVEHLEYNLTKINSEYADIKSFFENAGIINFVKLPDDRSVRGRIAKSFKELNEYLEAAYIQGFTWEQTEYEFSHNDGSVTKIKMAIDHNTYLVIALRYKEMFSGIGTGNGTEDIPFEIDGHLTEIDTGQIDSDYMNSRFDKYLKSLNQEGVSEEEKQKILDDLHKSFATLTQEEQKYANIFLHNVQYGDAVMDEGKTFRDYVTEYQFKAKNEQVHQVAVILGVDEVKLKNIMVSGVTEETINEYGRFDELNKTVDKVKAKEYFEAKEGKTIPQHKLNGKTYELLKQFIVSGGFDL